MITSVRASVVPLVRNFRGFASSRLLNWRLRRIQEQCRNFTMISRDGFIDNLRLIDSVKNIPGCVVECGVWRGGMSAGMAMFLGPGRKYYLFDSFEGLPPAKPIDGEAANHWQQNREAPGYFDNCSAPETFATSAMTMAGVASFRIVKGWFDRTLPIERMREPIAVLRLDGDWYESTTTCLEHLFGQVSVGGVVIFDDYYTWDGCSRAVHDFLSRHSRPERVRTFGYFAYLLKLPESSGAVDAE
jgi:O-methyltransferase